MICSAFTFLSAEITIKLMTWVSPIFIFCLMYGFLRPMFNNWLMTIISSVLTLMFASLVLKIGTNYLDKTIQKATTLVESVNIITLAVQVFIIYIAAAFLVWLSAKIATQLAGWALMVLYKVQRLWGLLVEDLLLPEPLQVLEESLRIWGLVHMKVQKEKVGRIKVQKV